MLNFCNATAEGELCLLQIRLDLTKCIFLANLSNCLQPDVNLKIRSYSDPRHLPYVAVLYQVQVQICN